jgi:hypothetical protein
MECGYRRGPGRRPANRAGTGCRTRTVTGFPKAQYVTMATLRTAEVPADCRLPAQRLVNGKTTHGFPGGGQIITDAAKVGFADLAGLGYNQALTENGCSAGGVSWPRTWC